MRGFQAKRGFDATGRVDPRTWRRLQAMTDTPTHDSALQHPVPGPVLLAGGAQARRLRDLQARLVATSWLFGDVTPAATDHITVARRAGVPGQRAIPVTGEVDARRRAWSGSTR